MTEPEQSLPSLEEVDQQIASLRKQRAQLSVLLGEEPRDWVMEELQNLLAQLDYQQLMMLRGLLMTILGPGIDASTFSIKTDWDLTRRGPYGSSTPSTDY